MTKKIFSGIICIVLALAMAVPVLAQSKIEPRGEPHCSKGNLYVKSTDVTPGTVTRQCEHGAVGGVDESYTTTTIYTYKCTGCAFTTTVRGNIIYGPWHCLN